VGYNAWSLAKRQLLASISDRLKSEGVSSDDIPDNLDALESDWRLVSFPDV